jgi:hypothetical protein
LDTHTVEHVGGEKRETSTGKRTEKGVTGDSRSSARGYVSILYD